MTFYAYETPLGIGYLEAEDGKVTGVLFPGSSPPVRIDASPAGGDVDKTLRFLEDYFRGDMTVDTSDLSELLDTAGIKGFARRVMEEVSRIPRGETRSYGEVAAAAGSPGAARAVGNIMASNPLPILVPCHRVVLASGQPGGFGGSPELKVWLLTLESN
jgi:methylated-DNA-[protein]-cysteine S-methyltransferase